jgi:hypothetical protein
LFKVPVCSIESDGKRKPILSELDYNTSENKIGEIVNLSQKLNSVLWDKLSRGYNYESIQGIYEDVCKLAVLSGIEIDKAKRAYDKVKVSKEISKISNKHSVTAPEFFKEIDFDYGVKERKHTFYNAPMEYVYKNVKDIDYRKGKEKEIEYTPISNMLKVPAPKSTSTVYEHRDKVVDICKEFEKKLDFLYSELRRADDDEKEVVYTRIKQTKEERNEKVKRYLDEEYVLYLILKDYEKEENENWHLYAPLLETELFMSMLEYSREQMLKVVEKDEGEYDLYGLKFTKI